MPVVRAYGEYYGDGPFLRKTAQAHARKLPPPYQDRQPAVITGGSPDSSIPVLNGVNPASTMPRHLDRQPNGHSAADDSRQSTRRLPEIATYRGLPAVNPQRGTIVSRFESPARAGNSAPVAVPHRSPSRPRRKDEDEKRGPLKRRPRGGCDKDNWDQSHRRTAYPESTSKQETKKESRRTARDERPQPVKRVRDKRGRQSSPANEKGRTPRPQEIQREQLDAQQLDAMMDEYNKTRAAQSHLDEMSSRIRSTSIQPESEAHSLIPTKVPIASMLPKTNPTSSNSAKPCPTIIGDSIVNHSLNDGFAQHSDDSQFEFTPEADRFFPRSEHDVDDSHDHVNSALPGSKTSEPRLPADMIPEDEDVPMVMSDDDRPQESAISRKTARQHSSSDLRAPKKARYRRPSSEGDYTEPEYQLQGSEDEIDSSDEDDSSDLEAQLDDAELEQVLEESTLNWKCDTTPRSQSQRIQGSNDQPGTAKMFIGEFSMDRLEQYEYPVSVVSHHLPYKQTKIVGERRVSCDTVEFLD